VAPCGTVTVEGTLTAGLELESDTTTPPIPAAVVRVTIPVPDWPLRIVLGLTQTLLSARDGGLKTERHTSSGVGSSQSHRG
jgi:hypothetical protein